MANFKFGRLRPRARPPMLRLGNYLLRTATPPPPAIEDWSQKALTGLEMVLANDTLGCCTSSGAGHIEDVFYGNTGVGKMASEADAIAFYSKSTGYIPGDPSTDQGGDETVVLSVWRDKGYFSDGSGKISGYVSVNATDVVEVQTAIWLFGNVYFGVELADAWVNPMPQSGGFVWGVAGPPNPNNGHCFVGTGYSQHSVHINSWGMFGNMPWDAVAKYAVPAAGGALYTVLSSDWISAATSKSPSGFAFEELQNDLAALA